jgi:hypothetical protein
MCYTFFVGKAGQFESVTPLVPVKPDNVTFPDFIEKGALEHYLFSYAQSRGKKRSGK